MAIRFGRQDLYSLLADRKRVAVQCRISNWLSFVFLDASFVFDITVNVMPYQESELEFAFAVLQSRPHEIWARFFARR